MNPFVIHVVISLDPGGLERLVVDMTNARNAETPGATRVVCLDHRGAMANECKVQSEKCKEAESEGSKTADASIELRRPESPGHRPEIADGKKCLVSSVQLLDTVICVDADRSRFPWDREAVKRLRETIDSICSEKYKVKSLRAGRNNSKGTLNLEPGTLNRRVVLHAHNMAAWQYAVLAAKGTKAKVVYTQHGANPHVQGLRNRLRAKWLSSHTAEIIAVSNSTADSMTALLGIPAGRISVVHNGVTTAKKGGWGQGAWGRERGAEIRKEYGLTNAAVIVGSVGRFSQEKNYPMLVEAFAQVHQSHPSIRLLLVGNGVERKNIEAAIDKHKVGAACILPGYRENVEPWLRTIDVFCLSSDSEGMSVALLEAGGQAKPAVVTDVGANCEVVRDGVDGYVVPRGDKAGLAQALARLADDKQLLKKMGESFQARVRMEYSLDKMMSSYEAIYGRLWTG